MARRGWRVAVGIVAVVTLVVACRQLVGIGDEPPMSSTDAGPVGGDGAADAGASCGIAYAGASCEKCLERACCDTARTCASGTACAALEGCLGACGGDPTCRARCVDEHRIGPDPAEADFAACLAANCSTSCTLGGCGALAQMFGADAASSCQKCIVDHVCQPVGDCLANPLCQEQSWCRQFPALDQLETCESAHDAATDPFAGYGAIYQALGTSCAIDCAWGNQWWCVGHVTTPTANPTGTVMTVALSDEGTGAPIAGASVNLCAPNLGLPCVPISSGTTDDAGLASVTIPATQYTPGPTGFIYIDDGGVYPSILYWNFPMSEPNVYLVGPGLTTFDVSLLSGALNVSVDQSRAIVGVRAFDCDSVPSPGVRFDVTPSDPDTRVFYTKGQNLDLTATETDAYGVALVVNVPVDAGSVTVTAKPAALGGQQPSSVVSGIVQGHMATGLTAGVTQ
ncbi:MAG TPA: hypothetical protein VMI75_26915 [Polyangiaceae bacterium]|nr:hypothetical protein [Polyangiaceae bacterium]